MIRVRMIGGQARRGDNGKNSYELALQEGYTGTLQQWLNERRGTGGAANFQDYAQTFNQNRNSTLTQADQEQTESLVGKSVTDFINKNG